MSLEVDIDHRQGGFRLQAAFSAAGGLTALFGRSGSGKTSLLNAIAGLARPTRGRITLAGEILSDAATGRFTPPHRRRIGYVFQEGRLFPHLDVRQNLLFGRWFSPERRGGPSLGEVADLLGVAPLLARRPGGLSGGEKQRVAIGRALLARPRLLLLDEPFAALDDERKRELLPYVERLRDETRLPMVYVSHSLAEVARLADRVVVLEAGAVAAAGAAADVLARLDLPALDDQDAGAALDAVVARHDEAYGLTVLDIPGGRLHTPRAALAPGSRTRVLIRARDVMLSLSAPVGLSALNVISGEIEAIAPGAASMLVRLRIEGSTATLTARVTRKSFDMLGLRVGMACHAIVKSVALAPA